jgi:hypothetical protein
MIALSYIGLFVTLAIILGFLGRIPNSSRGDPNVYTYSKRAAWVFFSGIPLLVIAAGFIFIFGVPPKSRTGIVVVIAIWVVVIFLFTLAFIYVRRLSIRIEGNEIRVSGFLIRRNVLLSAVRRYVAVEGDNGSRSVQIFDGNNQSLFKVADTIQDFDSLTAQIRHLLPKHGVKYESRDKWGKWTRKVVD